MKLAIGIDVGTTNCKAGLFDETGHSFGVACQTTPQRTDGTYPVAAATCPCKIPCGRHTAGCGKTERKKIMACKIGVVGDDITGSNDIGIMFAKAGLFTDVFSFQSLNRETYPDCDALIIDTDSRFDDPKTAYDKVYLAAKMLLANGAKQFYKKTCSVFRGNIGAEFDAMLDASGKDFAVVVAAFPKNGRTTVHSLHYVNGVPLADTNFRHDPMNPITCSSLMDILRQQTKRPIHPIVVEDLDQGDAHLRHKLQQCRAIGGYALFDARNQKDLKLIAGAIHDEPIICGASAIAEETAVYLKSDFPASLYPGWIPDTKKGILVACGSLTPQTLAQIAYAAEHGAQPIEFNSLCIFDESKRSKELSRLTAEAAAKIDNGEMAVLYASNSEDQVLATKRLGKENGLAPAEVSKLVSGTLAELSQRIIGITGQRRVIIAGGDTSAAFCERMQIHGMTVYQEIEPGLPSCITIGNEPLFLVLKSGSFGKEGFFFTAARHLRSNENGD